MALRFASLALAGFSCVALACDVGSVNDNNQSQTDGATASSDGGGADAIAPDPNCLPGVTPPGDGKHNAGNNCIQQGCHDGAGAPPQWTIAGTLYKDPAGTTALAGATMVFTDANNQEITLITHQNGNFYTGQAIAFPIKAKTSSCPNSMSMGTSIAANMGGCNQAGCHDANKRMYLPQ